MRARYRVVLQGFSEFERNALTFCLKLTGDREAAYEPVPRMPEADFVIADADMAGVIDTVVRAGRTRDTVFVGRKAAEGSRSHVLRPIDPNLIVRELDQLLEAREAAAPRGSPPPTPPRRPEPEPETEPEPVDVIPPSLLSLPVAEATEYFGEPNTDELPTVPSGLDELMLKVEPAEIVAPPPVTVPAAWYDVEPEPASAHTPEPAPEPAPAPIHAPAIARGPMPPAEAPAPIAAPEPAAPAAETGLATDERAAAKAAARAAARSAARRARLAQASPATEPGHPPDALVLDDSDIAQVFLCRLLSDFGFRPHPVQGSLDALDLLARQAFTVVFLDVQLDGQDEHDGIDLCHLIKHQPMTPDGVVPAVIVVSGQARPADRVRAGLAGCDVFLTKPLSRGDVARALESCGVALPSDARRR